MKAMVILSILVIFFLNFAQAGSEDPYTKSLSVSKKYFESNELMREKAIEKGTAWADALNIFHDGLVIYYYNQELIRGEEIGKAIGQYEVRSAWYDYGWSDHFALSNQPDFDNYPIELPGHFPHEKKQSTIESPDNKKANEHRDVIGYNNGITYGEHSIGKEEKRELYYLGYADTNKNGKLSEEETINLINDWYNDKIKLIDLVEVLNIYSDSFNLNLLSNSEIPSIEIVADKPYLDCRGGYMKLTVTAKRYNIIPLQDANAIVKAEPIGLKYPSSGQQFRGKTDSKGEFVLDNINYEVPNSVTLGGGSITFSAAFTDEWINANKGMFLPDCDNCVTAISSAPSARLSLSMNCNQYDNPLLSKGNGDSYSTYIIQAPSTQQSKDELRDELISKIKSGIKIKYIIKYGDSKIHISSSGIWTLVSGNEKYIRGLGTEEIRWGDSTEEDTDCKSGLRFEPSGLVSAELNTNISLGELIHFNWETKDDTDADAAVMTLKVDFPDPEVPPGLQFKINFDTRTTDNEESVQDCDATVQRSKTPCDDMIKWKIIKQSQYFNVGNTTYTFEILGFFDSLSGGSQLNEFTTEEKKTNRAYLIGRIIPSYD